MARPNTSGEEVFYIRFWNATDVGFEMRGFEIFQLDSPFWGGWGLRLDCCCRGVKRRFLCKIPLARFMLGFTIFTLDFSLFALDFPEFMLGFFVLCSIFEIYARITIYLLVIRKLKTLE